MAKIIDYELYTLPSYNLLLKIQTADGLIGWGSPSGHLRSVRAAVESLMDNFILNQSPTKIQDHWEAMYRGTHHRGGPTLMGAIAGIDHALWDLKGKRHGAPVYDLLGGPTRDRVRVYEWIGGDTPDELAVSAEDAVEDGMKAVKFNAASVMRHVETPSALDSIVQRVAAVRDAVGSDVDIAVDFHGRISKSMAKRVASAIEPYEPMFIEEPVLPENYEAHAELVTQTTIPLATGERSYSRWDFKHLLQNGGLDIIQPNVSVAGGITECKKIGDIAEMHDIAVSLQGASTAPSFAACLHLCYSISNVLVQPMKLNQNRNHRRSASDYLSDGSAFTYDDGYVTLGDAPGFGIELDLTKIREQSMDNTGHHYPIQRKDDGSVAER